MNYQIIGKNIEVTEAIRSTIERKLDHLERFFHGEEVNCRAVVRSYTVGAKVEITIFTKEMDFRAEVKNDDLYAAVDLAIDKLEGQIRKLKTMYERRKDVESLASILALEEIEEIEGENDEIVRAKRIHLEPMTIDQAIARMNAIGHTFFLYLDVEDDEISVVYERNDGGYGVIQADNRLA